MVLLDTVFSVLVYPGIETVVIVVVFSVFVVVVELVGLTS
jgi:hypothetical protein